MSVPVQQEIPFGEPRGVPRALFKFRRYHFALFSLIAALFAMPFYILSRPAEIKPVPQLIYTPEELVNSLPVRLAYLQARTTNVAFYIYTVKMRDNLWKLATKNRYSVHSIIGCNPQLETYEINYKQKLLIPSKAGTLHIVQKGETLDSISARYKTTAVVLMRFNTGGQRLVKGDMLFVPDRRPDMELMNDKMREKYEMRALFVSPLGGRLTSTFGTRRHPVTGKRSLHGGIDIAVRQGTWVGAAAEGIVTVASSGIGHYGTAVFIEHQNGYETHYGHLSSIRVRVGQKVKARQLIAKSGSTGRSTGPHLHFTIKKNGAQKDPLKFIW